jgi:hypothetical protein
MATTFNPFTGNPDYITLDTVAGDSRYLKLDQTTPQTIISGTPIFNVGIKSNDAVVIKAEKLLILDGA